MTSVHDPMFQQAFGDLDQLQQIDAWEIIEKLSTAVHDLIPLMDGEDNGGAVRVGYMLVQLGKHLAAVE